MRTGVARLRRGIAFGRSDRAVRLAALATVSANAVLLLLVSTRPPTDPTWAPIALAVGVLALAAFLRPIEPAPGEKFSVAAAATFLGAVILPASFAVMAAGGAALTAKVVQGRSPLSAAVNTSQVAGATAAAALALSGTGEAGALPITVAALAYFVVTLGSVALMIVAAQGLPAAAAFVRRETLPTAALLGIGGVAGLAWTKDPLAIVLFLPALAAIELAVRRPAAHRSATAAAEGSRGGTAVDAAHELRTPLATLASDLAYISSPLPRAEAVALASAKHEVRRLSELVDRLLLLGRVEGALAAEVRDVAAATGRALRTLELHERVDIVVDVGPGLRVRLSEELLVTIIRDMVTNALAYTREGSVHVSARGAGERVAILVRDTGIGISADELRHVFDRFYRGRRAAAMASGTGLGLAIVRRIVEAAKGEIVIDSEVDRGTEVAIFLPRGEVAGRS